MAQTTIEQNLLRPEETAQALSTSLRTLARWRSSGDGPPWFQVGRSVFYRTTDIQEWVDQQLEGRVY